MSFIPTNINAVEEAKPVPNGRYDLVISSCEEKLSSKQQLMYKIVLNIEGHDEAPAVYHYLPLPDTSDDDGGKNKTLQLRRFVELFKIDGFSDAGFDTEVIAQNMPGCRASGVELVQEVYNDNVSNKMKIPRLNSGGATKGTGRPPTAAAKKA